jgi:hypothetical protein
MAPDVAAAVGATGRFARDAVRRNLETLAFFEAVTVEDGLNRQAAAFKDIVRVGLMHAQVSAALRRKWGGDAFEAFGAPISVSSLAQGYLSFGIVPVLHDHALGNHCTVAELEAVSDYWGYITYLFGAPESDPRHRRTDARLQ